VIGEFARQAHRGRGERGKEDRDGLFGRCSEPKGPDVLTVERQAIALEQRSDGDERGAEPIDRLLPDDSVQALHKRRAAGPEPEGEAPARRALQARRGHGDRRRSTTPDRQHTGAEPDPRRHSGDLRQQHDRVVGPPLGGAETGIAELLGAHGQPDRRVGIRLKRRHAGADARPRMGRRAARVSRVG
jgi:hypothetical protein